MAAAHIGTYALAGFMVVAAKFAGWAVLELLAIEHHGHCYAEQAKCDSCRS
jgi:hypothetical protein